MKTICCSGKRCLSFHPLVFFALALLAACGNLSEDVTPTSSASEPQTSAAYSTNFAGSPINYAYDAAGRLIAVYDPNGNAAQYVYDPAGNITAINRLASSTLAIFGVTPTTGPKNTNVTITGSGFSTTKTSNTVKFNGVSATVVAATAQQLLVTSPNSTTGTITVQVGSTTVTSPNAFTVGTAAPAISSISSQMGSPNGTLVITGTGFQTKLSDNAVLLGYRYAQVTAATATQLNVTVPPLGNGGKITVTTPFGSAVGSQDFYVLPAGLSGGNVTTLTRLTADGNSVSVSLTAAGKTGLVLLDVGLSDVIGLGLTGVSLKGATFTNLTVNAPDGTVLAPITLNSNASVTLPVMPEFGTCMLILPAGTGSTGLKVTLTASRPVTGTLNANGPALSFATTRPGQNAVYSFSANSGDNLTLTQWNPTFAGVYVVVATSQGTTLASSSFGASSTTSNVYDLQVPATGTYAVTISPTQGIPGSLSTILMPEVIGLANPINGNATMVNLLAGQDGSYSFSAPAGAYVGFGVPTFSTSPSNTPVNFTVSDANNNPLTYCVASSPDSCGFPAFPSNGNYKLLVSASNYATVTLGMLLSNEITGAVPLDATPVTFSTARIGQGGRYAFTTNSNSDLSLTLSGITIPSALVQALDPNGYDINQVIASPNQTFSVYLSGLTANSNYTLVVSPSGASIGNLTMAMQPVTGHPVAINGATSVISLKAGQLGSYTFNGTSGNTVGLGFSSLATTPSGQSVEMDIYAPDTSFFQSCTISGPDNCSLFQLMQTGNYSVQVTPASGSALQFQVIASSALSGNITVGGTASTFSTARVGQSGIYSFAVAANSSHSIALTSCTFPSGMTGDINDPSGNFVQSLTAYPMGGNANINLTHMTAGTYTISFTPSGTDTGQVSVSVN